MPAFRPNPTESTVRLATWLFIRVVAAIGLITFVAVGLTELLFPGSFGFFVSQVAAFLIVLWCSAVLLFEAFDTLLDAKLESARGEDESGG